MQQALRYRTENVRWISPEQSHVTLKFLGEVADRDVSAAIDAVTEAASTVEPFTLELGGCGCFPSAGPVRAVWVGAANASGAMAACVERIECALEPLGFPLERRPFSPHVTIGRIRYDRTDGRLRSTVASRTFGPTSQLVASITVMSSELSPTGPLYTPAATIALETTEPSQEGEKHDEAGGNRRATSET